MTVAKATRRGRIWRYVLVSLLVLLLLTLSLLNTLLTPVAARRLKEAVDKGSDNAYALRFTHLHLNVFTGSLQLDSVQLVADNAKLAAAADSLGGRAQTLTISGIQVLHYLLHRELRIDSIRLERPFFTYCRRKRTPSQPHPRSLYQRLSATLQEVAVGHVRFAGAELAYQDRSIPSLPHLTLKELELDADSFLVDAATQQDTSRTLFCKNIQAAIRNFEGHTTGGLYHYHLSRAYLSTSRKKLVLQGLSIVPLPAARFFAVSRNDRFDFRLQRLELAGFSCAQLFSQHLFYSARISGANGHIAVFGNPHGRPKHNDRLVSFPHYVVRKLPVSLRVDTLALSGIAVRYSEWNPANGQTGTISFEQTQGLFLHISNQPGELQQFPFCTADLSTLLLGKARLNVAIRFSLTDSRYRYAYSGALASMPAAAVSPVTRPLAQVGVTGGRLESLDFAVRADRYGSRGTMHLLYHDLAVEMLDPADRKKWVPTLAVNAFVIKHSNPDGPGKTPRYARIRFRRPKSFPFFKTMWQTLFTGMKACAGVGPAVHPKKQQSIYSKVSAAFSKVLKGKAKNAKAGQ